MKRSFLIILLGLFLFSSCGGDSRDEEMESVIPETVEDSLSTIEGEFIYLADAAVLKGQDFIYGVEIDSISMDLVDRVAPLKRDDFDMVPVTVRGKIIPNPRQEGWDEVVQIREILEVPEIKTDSTNLPTVKKEIQKP